MPLTRQQKEDIVADAHARLQDSAGVIFTDFSGVGTESLRLLRRKLKEAGAAYRVIKRTLIRIALKGAGVDVGNHLAKNSLGIVSLKEDLPAVAKALYEFGRKESTFTLLNAYDMNERRWLGGEEVLMLAKLPSRHDLLSQLVFMLQAPIKKLAMVTSEIAKQKE